ncbi:MAG TPA: hypothetical protein VFS05_04325 [Gemmatimonadaceae bacterium]|nr:hypothetical protein [Gemmatimonadaceae bacterium]
MSAIIIEGVLFVAFLATVAALLYYVVLYFTPVGVSIRQARNRRRIEREAEHLCARHGAHRAEELVRLPDGDRICPQCYEEAFHDQHDR